MSRPFLLKDQTPEQAEAERLEQLAALTKQRAEFDQAARDESATSYRPGDDPPAWMVARMLDFLRALKGAADGRIFVTSLNNEQRPANAPWEKKWKVHELLIDPAAIDAPMVLSSFVRRHGTDDRGIFVSPQPINHELACANQAAAEEHNKTEAARKKANPKHAGDRWSTSLRQKGHIAAIGSICFEIDFKHHAGNPPDEVLNRTLNGFFDSALQPSIVNLSPGGPHAFLLLDEPLEATAENLARVEAITAQLCDLYGGDPGALDCGHLLRLPYTFNTKAGHVKKNGGPVLVTPERSDLTRRVNVENIEAALADEPAGLYASGEWAKPKRIARPRTKPDGATVDNPFSAYARCHVGINPAEILAEVDNSNVRGPLLRAVGHFAWCGAGEDAVAAFLPAWAARLSASRGLGWDPHGKHLAEHLTQFRDDAAKAIRRGLDLGAERAKFAARWGAGLAGLEAYVNDRAALALEDIGAAVAAGENAESAVIAAGKVAALKELFDPKRAPKPDAERSKQERRAARLEVARSEVFSQVNDAEPRASGEQGLRSIYAGEVVFNPARDAWVDLTDDRKRRRSVFDERRETDR
ncbi:hypothetical protein [Rhodoblastus sp.]|uniref:hypothetical protein n=1 Tax=Rhodoblastus sp. TaxID=1962975 RepID=UPI0035B32F5E